MVFEVEACCQQWLIKNAAPTICPECEEQFIVTQGYEVVPLSFYDRVDRPESSND